MLLWISFIICTLIIFYGGNNLSKYGDIIAENTGIGRTWVGLVIVASVTSLPELITGISSVTFVKVPEIAVGDVLGSCIFNLLILGFVGFFYKGASISYQTHHGNILGACFNIILLILVSLGLFLQSYIFPIGWIGVYTILIIFTYFMAIRFVYLYEKRELQKIITERAKELKYKGISLKKAIFKYVFNAILVIIAASILPKIGKELAGVTNLGQIFVGNIFIAFSTSLPELVVSISALRLKAVDLAIGNLLGSNLFNIIILAVDDLFFTKGPLLSFVSKNHLIPALFSILMISIIIIGILYRTEKKKILLAWDSLLIIIIYLLNLMILYNLR
ncbi:sodium:calcium antiporter [Thermodesulfobacterium hydrogeniphilum]|uniref:sodium:calcium antiporter n=1 Tax=Thermodesulfobacterium hydrogeniphilum TaxID=161156 RepID=UPI000571D32C|nr:sodium:calcium antiporter [Thermodesulfobacterium hydrogeniphilum]